MNNSDRNLRFGWWSLLVFLSLGGALETLQGVKIGWYVDVGNDIRRLMFTLAHAHGTALALVNIVAGLTARNVERFELRPSVSFSLIWAGILSGWIPLRRHRYIRWRPRTGHLACACRRTAAVLQHCSHRA